MPAGRYYRLKEKNREESARKWQKIVFWSLFFLALSTVAWSFFFSPFFKITEVNIPQNDLVTNGHIKNFMESSWPFDLGENIFVLSQNQLRENLAAAFPDITDIVVKKEFLNSLTIDFKKRVQIGLWCLKKTGQFDQPDNCYFFDKEGIAFKEAPGSEGALILKVTFYDNQNFKIGNQVLDFKRLKFITGFNDAINKIGGLKITNFVLKPGARSDLEAVTDGNWSIYLNLDEDPESSINNLISTLNEAVRNKAGNLEYIDLRIPSRVFYKLKY